MARIEVRVRLSVEESWSYRGQEEVPELKIVLAFGWT